MHITQRSDWRRTLETSKQTQGQARPKCLIGSFMAVFTDRQDTGDDDVRQGQGRRPLHSTGRDDLNLTTAVHFCR